VVEDGVGGALVCGLGGARRRRLLKAHLRPGCGSTWATSGSGGGAVVGVHGGDGVLKWPVVARDRELTVEAAMSTAARLRHARARASSAHFIGRGGAQRFDTKEPAVRGGGVRPAWLPRRRRHEDACGATTCCLGACWAARGSG
jgi:hypothetical protein